MIKGIGLDMIEVERIEKAVQNERFIDKIFTPQEKVLIEERNNSSVRIAGMFAAKEAVAKALGKGFGKIKWTDIEVLRDNFGAPYIVLYNDALELISKSDKIHISITNLKDLASAVAIWEDKNI